jgi:hypothetical protein
MNNFKAFFHGFHYGVKHFETLEDKHFHTYFKDLDKSGHYRKGIKSARNYMLYRYELLTFTVIVFTSLLFMFTW